MPRIYKLTSVAQAEDYHKNDSYYQRLEGFEHVAGLRWGGSLAKDLGFKPGKEVDFDSGEWREALEGKFPTVDISKRGNVKNRAPAIDIEFSPPKSFSIQALVHGEHALIDVHIRAAKIAMTFFETQAAGRFGKAGSRVEQTRALLYAMTPHIASREGDPQMHLHVVVPNVTRGSDGSYRALDNRMLFQAQRIAQWIYFNELIRGARELGYNVVRSTDLSTKGPGAELGNPELAGISRRDIDVFSKRTAQIEAKLAKIGKTRETATQSQKNDFARKTRVKKEHKTAEDYKALWTAAAKESGIPAAQKGRPDPGLEGDLRRKETTAAVDFAINSLSERETVLSEKDVLVTALKHTYGRVSATDVLKEYEKRVKSGEIIRSVSVHGTKIVPYAAVVREQAIAHAVTRGKNTMTPVYTESQARALAAKVQDPALSEEQTAAMTLALSTSDRHIFIRGAAGTGKTTLLAPAVKALADAGFTVMGVGPQHSAVHALKDTGITRSQTLQSFLLDTKVTASVNAKTVIVCDEVGLADTKLLNKLAKLADERHCRVIYSGDNEQYQAVAAGPAGEILKRANVETRHVTKMVRQINADPVVREAAQASLKDPKDALDMLNKAGRVRESLDTKAIAETYKEKSATGDTLVLTGTHKMRRELNDAIREELHLTQKPQVAVTVFVADNSLTDAHKKSARALAACAGQDIVFKRDYKKYDVKVGESAHIDRVVGNFMHITKNDGTEKRLELGRITRFSVGKIEQITVAEGDRLRATSNDYKKDGITRHIKGTVTAIDQKEVTATIQFDKTHADGTPIVISAKNNPAKPTSLDHGYAQTGHSVQGQAAKNVIHVLPSNDPTLSQRGVYTDLTRTKFDTLVFTDNLDAVKAKITPKSKSLADDITPTMPKSKAEVSTVVDVEAARIRAEKAKEDKEAKEAQKAAELAAKEQKEREEKERAVKAAALAKSKSARVGTGL